MKRYLVFAGDDYYPSGGWNDFRDDFDDIDAAKTEARRLLSRYSWVQLIDLVTKEDIS